MNVIGVDTPIIKNNSKRDFKSVLTTIEVIKYFGLGPLAHKLKLLTIIIICLFLPLSFFALKNRYLLIDRYSVVLGKLEFTQGVFEVVYTLYCLIHFTFFAKNCREELVTFSYQLENSINLKTHAEESFHYLYPRLAVVFALFGISYAITFYLFITTNNWELTIALTTQIVALICSLLIFTYYMVMANWLRNKYDNFNLMVISTCEKEDVKFEDDVDEVIKYLEISSSVLNSNNKLFGTSVFLNNCLFIFIILHMTVAAIDQTPSDLPLKISQCIYPIPFVVFLAVLIMACDAVEKSGKQVIKTCYLLHETVKDEVNKEQLLLLARYAEHWSPVFSAAGFYEVNQSCLTSIFSAVITYLVIIIQFNMVLTE